MRHQLRVNHARAFAESGDANLLRRAVGAGDFDAGEGGLLHGVGGEDGVGDLKEAIGLSAQGCGKGGHRVNELVGRQRDTDDAGGRWKDLIRAAGEDAGGGSAGSVGGIEASLTGGAVGVAGVDGHHAHFSLGCGQVLLV